MASQRQINANRQNAQHSTGPKSPEGKRKSSLNRLKHGFHSADIVLPVEDLGEFDHLLHALYLEHQPATPTEEILVRDMAAAHWRLTRLARIETGLFMRRMESAMKYDKPGKGDPHLAETEEDEDTWLLGCAYSYDTSGADSFDRLRRHESMLRRAFYKALNELRRLRDHRSAAVPAPPKPKTDETNPIPKSDTPLPGPVHSYEDASNQVLGETLARSTAPRLTDRARTRQTPECYSVILEGRPDFALPHSFRAELLTHDTQLAL